MRPTARISPKMTENGTLEGVSTLRFASFGPKGSDLEAMLAKEFDLAALLGAADVVRVMAVANGNAINVLAKLANDVNVSIEVGAGLPKGELGYDRHEIIAKRGVADDTRIPHMGEAHAVDAAQPFRVEVAHLSRPVDAQRAVGNTGRVAVAKETGKDLINDDFSLHPIIGVSHCRKLIPDRWP